MKFIATYKVLNVNFRHEAENAYELFEAVSAILKTNKLMYPEQERTLSEYLMICADIASGKMNMYETHLFRIEANKEEK